MHFEIDASTMEAALSVLENYPDESAANPEQNGKIEFAAIITDRACLLYTSDAADEQRGVDLGGRRIIKRYPRSKCNSGICNIKKSLP